ncbi:hypothetical protein TVAG_478730 [Trichomonas vaginalis G3]|uniref:HEAT repeat family protein n=1 Tax=Trichomonas vaginalis (strain ATCC PRA-98 / G3) TaxID=412133 RepID=A2DZY9_TRIV3|nr:armadillo (ARM) repeat-containing protein family [Trichomonas vaginalis G3]EAY14048.1 hypothetical protein TVAG_478730 [Trichomonas vaginalis G3]KAI5519510.1 armadillo (ARM) repeat-containing protein family [Trichomonas vaginalis G3]|eukprot:XP_001326271.1 hypothetical protein [Trichomonas vaginalis G3]
MDYKGNEDENTNFNRAGPKLMRRSNEKARQIETKEHFDELFQQIFEDYTCIDNFDLEQARKIITLLSIHIEPYDEIDTSFLVEKDLLNLISRYLQEVYDKYASHHNYYIESYMPVAKLISSLLRMHCLSEIDLLKYNILQFFEPLIEFKNIEILKQANTMDLYIKYRNTQLNVLATFYEYFADTSDVKPKLCKPFFNFSTKSILDFEDEYATKAMYFASCFVMKNQELTAKQIRLILKMSYSALTLGRAELYSEAIWILRVAIARDSHQCEIFFRYFHNLVFPLLLSVKESVVEDCLRLISQILSVDPLPYDIVLPTIPIKYIIQNCESIGSVVQIQSFHCLYKIAMSCQLGSEMLLQNDIIPNLIVIFDAACLRTKQAILKVLSAIMHNMPSEYYIPFYTCNVIEIISEFIESMDEKDVVILLGAIDRMIEDLSFDPRLNDILALFEGCELLDIIDSLSDSQNEKISVIAESILNRITPAE